MATPTDSEPTDWAAEQQTRRDRLLSQCQQATTTIEAYLAGTGLARSSEVREAFAKFRDTVLAVSRDLPQAETWDECRLAAAFAEVETRDLRIDHIVVSEATATELKLGGKHWGYPVMVDSGLSASEVKFVAYSNAKTAPIIVWTIKLGDLLEEHLMSISIGPSSRKGNVPALAKLWRSRVSPC